jgi:hypothetical protein
MIWSSGLAWPIPPNDNGRLNSFLTADILNGLFESIGSSVSVVQR